jgi:hypothetical protein
VADPKKPTPTDPRAVRDLAAALFARLYDPRPGKTVDYQAADAITAARAFFRAWDDQSPPG